jgi:thioredoxin reductase (NADPH)
MTQEAAISETPDLHGADPRLSLQQIEALSRHGERRRTKAGEVLFREGDPTCDFFVVLEGLVEVVEGSGGERRLIAVHGPGRFLGELNMLTGQAVLLTAVVREPGQVLAVPAEEVRRLVAKDPALGDLVLRAFLIRRSLLLDIGAGLRIIGSRFSPDSRRLREFAARNRLPHHWIDLEDDAAAEALLRELGIKPEETPVVILSGEVVLRNPSNAELARRLGLRVQISGEAVWDLVIVGAGPAGLAAAVYGASEGLATIVVESVATGGQAGTSPRIENYLGFPSGLSGMELAERAVIQAEKFGARISVPAAAQGLDESSGHHVLKLEDGTELLARAVLIATGARYRRLPVARLEEFEGNGVYYAATLVEAHMCRDGAVAVVGGGNSAGQAALFLAQYAQSVHLLVRHDDLGRDMSPYLIDQIGRHPRVEVYLNTEVKELLGGSGNLEPLVVEDNRTGERRQIEARAVFVFIGADPCVSWLGRQLALDENGYILTGAAAAGPDGHGEGIEGTRAPLLLETSRPGVFASGDVRSGATRRVASAVGEGAMAVQMVHERLAEMGHVAAGHPVT